MFAFFSCHVTHDNVIEGKKEKGHHKSWYIVLYNITQNLNSLKCVYMAYLFKIKLK